MKKHFLTSLIISALILVGGTAFVNAEEQKSFDSQKVFFYANMLYEKGEYQKALEQYDAILKRGLQGGNLYYNMGNCYMKMGKVGYAVLLYERAKRYIPGDGDLKSNLDYAKSLLEGKPVEPSAKNFILSILEKPLKDSNINAITITLFAVYVGFLVSVFIFIAFPLFRRKWIVMVVVMSLAFLFILFEFGIRYYDEMILSYGIVVNKDVESRYEPIDKAAIFFKLREGDKVRILKTRLGWRQIERVDGKRAWIEKDKVEEI